MPPQDGTSLVAQPGEAALVSRIRLEIAAAPGRRITFARYMEMALTEPGLGYYATSDRRPTREGDFLTAPELHPFFGRCIGRLLTELWRRLDAPATFVVREWGAGRGTLAATVASGLSQDSSGLASAIQWQPLDIPGRHPAVDPTLMTGVALANEYLDALPVHRLVRRGERVLERFVTWDAGGFREIEGEPSHAALTGPLDAAGIILAEGQLAEVRPAADDWLRQVAESLERGVVLVIDYGGAATSLYARDRMAGSLVTYRDHAAGDDPFVATGLQDITAHVDTSALERTAAAVGLESLGVTTQGRLMAGLGLGELLYQLGRDPATRPPEYLAARASVARLLDPRHLGAFRVLAFGRDIPALPVLPGFDAPGVA